MAKTNYSPTFPMFPGDAEAVTPSDTDRFAPSVLYCGTGGTVRVLTAQGSDVTFLGTMPGAVLPVQVVRVFATTTVATMLVRMSSGVPVPMAAIPWAIDGTGAQLRDALNDPSAWGETLGPELVANGGFDSDTWWTKGAGITIAGGVGVYTSVANNIALSRAVFGEQGRVYDVTYTIVSLSGGGFGVYINGAQTATRFGLGTQTQRITAGTADNFLQVRAVGTTTGTIDNISIREVVTGWLLPGLGGARLSGDCRTSVAMETLADGTVGYAAHNLLFSSDTAAGFSPSSIATDNGVIAVELPAGVPSNSQVRSVSYPLAVSGWRFGTTTGGTIGAPYAGGVWLRTASGTADLVCDMNDGSGVAVAATTTWQFVSASRASATDAWQFFDIAKNSGAAVTLYFCAPRVCFGMTAAVYVPTGTAGPRYGPAIDWLSVISDYVVRSEAARTNLVLYSADMGNAAWQTFNTGATKVGAATALGAVPMYRVNVGSVGGASGASAVFQSVTVAATTTYSVSVIARSVSGTSPFRLWFDASGGPLFSADLTATTTAQLFTYTFTTVAGVASANIAVRAATAGGVVGDIEVGGFQLEAGTEASSRILTYAATATRAADTLIEIVATSVAGTMVIDYVPRVAGSQVIAQLDDTTANERHRVMNDGIYDVVDGGVTQASVDGGTPTVGALNRVAVTWQANRFAISLNGGAAVEDLSGTVPTTTRLLLASVANASIVRQRLVSGQSVNISQLQALSA